MKKIILLFLASLTLTACSPEIGSEDWCSDMKEKDKGDWTVTEAKDYAKHCLFKKSLIDLKPHIEHISI